MILHKYKIYCETDAKYEYTDFRDSALPAPTTCPTNTAHTCTASSVAIHETMEQNYQVDTESAQLNRLKYAPKGWTYQAHFMELTTSKVSGVYSKDRDGNDTGFCALKFYKADGSEITSGLQADLDAYCVHTKLIWTPGHSVEIISGSVKNLADTSTDIRMWATAAPHIPSANGGTKQFIQGGLNLKFLGAKTTLKTDGRSSKHIAHDTTYYSHIWHFDLKHPAGYQHTLEILLEFYKA